MQLRMCHHELALVATQGLVIVERHDDIARPAIASTMAGQRSRSVHAMAFLFAGLFIFMQATVGVATGQADQVAIHDGRSAVISRGRCLAASRSSAPTRYPTN